MNVADSVIEWADWLATCTPPPPPTAGPGSTAAGRQAALAQIRTTLATRKDSH